MPGNEDMERTDIEAEEENAAGALERVKKQRESVNLAEQSDKMLRDELEQKQTKGRQIEDLREKYRWKRLVSDLKRSNINIKGLRPQEIEEKAKKLYEEIDAVKKTLRDRGLDLETGINPKTNKSWHVSAQEHPRGELAGWKKIEEETRPAPEEKKTKSRWRFWQ